MRHVGDKGWNEALEGALRLEASRLRTHEIARAETEEAWTEFVGERAQGAPRSYLSRGGPPPGLDAGGGARPGRSDRAGTRVAPESARSEAARRRADHHGDASDLHDTGYAGQDGDASDLHDAGHSGDDADASDLHDAGHSGDDGGASRTGSPGPSAHRNVGSPDHSCRRRAWSPGSRCLHRVPGWRHTSGSSHRQQRTPRWVDPRRMGAGVVNGVACVAGRTVRQGRLGVRRSAVCRSAPRLVSGVTDGMRWGPTDLLALSLNRGRPAVIDPLTGEVREVPNADFPGRPPRHHLECRRRGLPGQRGRVDVLHLRGRPFQ